MSHAPFTNTCTFIAKSYECNDNCHLCHFCVALIILVVGIVMHMHTYTHTNMNNYTNRHTDICFAGVGTPTTRSTFMIVSTHTHTHKAAYETLESSIGCPTWLTFELLPYFSVNDKRMAVHRHIHTHKRIYVYMVDITLFSSLMSSTLAFVRYNICHSILLFRFRLFTNNAQTPWSAENFAKLLLLLQMLMLHHTFLVLLFMAFL